MTIPPARAGKAQEPRLVEIAAPTILHVPRALLSPNKWQGRHWRFKHRETMDWETEIHVAAVLADRRVRLRRDAIVPFRRRVTVTRIVPSKRNFIKDDDNLRFSVKPLNDALKRLGLIYQDSREWLEQPMPMQIVSETGEWATEIQIETLA